MNGWCVVACYLASCIIVPTIFLVFWVDGDKRHEIVSGDDIILTFLFCVLWPLAVPITITNVVKAARKRSAISKCKGIASIYNFDRMSPHDRSAMIEIPESELKYILKHTRNGNIEIPKHMIEMVREELMNREAERNLLGKVEE